MPLLSPPTGLTLPLLTLPLLTLPPHTQVMQLPIPAMLLLTQATLATVTTTRLNFVLVKLLEITQPFQLLFVISRYKK